jgi:hypothetical protein
MMTTTTVVKSCNSRRDRSKEKQQVVVHIIVYIISSLLLLPLPWCCDDSRGCGGIVVDAFNPIMTWAVGGRRSSNNSNGYFAFTVRISTNVRCSASSSSKSDDFNISGSTGRRQQQLQQQQEIRRQPIGRITSLDRSKIDSLVDTAFYKNPNLVTHTDDGFIESLQDVYRRFLLSGQNDNMDETKTTTNDDDLVVLDLMSSHVSHYPPDVLSRIRRVDVHGMNEEELQQNPARQSTNGNIYVRDLNANPSLVGLGLLDISSQSDTTAMNQSPNNSIINDNVNSRPTMMRLRVVLGYNIYKKRRLFWQKLDVS